MARMRSLKPEFWLDRKLARLLTRDERMLYMGLWNQADEWGRAQGDPRVVRGQIFPYEDDLTLAVIEKMLRSLHEAGVVVMYEVDGDPYLFLPKLAEHQRLEPHKVESRHPAPPGPAPEPGSDESAQNPSGAQINPSGAQIDPSGARAKHVAGSREHVAGTRGADESAQPPPQPKSKTDRRKPSRSLPDDFTITDEMRAWHRERQLADDDVDAETERFQRDALAKDRRYVDWSRAWQNWIDRAVKWGHLTPRAAASSSSLPSWELR